MLKILIVDDDALTRKGIQLLMPWEKHQMQIVGEAPNGREALAFLKNNPVDLVLVDLDMPIMNGMAFIKHASQLYPNLNYVVLTIHTEFEYIQEALRNGAIDYIAKTQFDKENFDQILDRIHSSIIKKNAVQQNSSDRNWKASKILFPSIYALITVETESDEHIFNFWEQNNLSSRNDIFELLPGVWVFTDTRSSFLFPDNFPNTMLLHISGVSDMTYKQLSRQLRTYVNNLFFYDYQPLKTINNKYVFELSEEEYLDDPQKIEHIKKEWLSLNWIHKNDLFDKIRFDLKNSKLKPSTLYHLLLTLETIWNTSYSELTKETITLPPTFHSWSEVEQWLMKVYEKTNFFQASSKYSSAVTRSILHVKNYIDTHYAQTIDATEISRNANMSSGYFSRCFHDIVGISFSDYCTQIRISHAKTQLHTTEKSIQQIAFDVGYNDEKYFSRLFKKITGQNPSDFRKS